MPRNRNVGSKNRMVAFHSSKISSRIKAPKQHMTYNQKAFVKNQKPELQPCINISPLLCAWLELNVIVIPAAGV